MQFWQAQHDKKLLYGVLKHGWAQWQVILKDSLLSIEPVMRQELSLPPSQPQQLPALSSPDAAAVGHGKAAAVGSGGGRYLTVGHGKATAAVSQAVSNDGAAADDQAAVVVARQDTAAEAGKATEFNATEPAATVALIDKAPGGEHLEVNPTAEIVDSRNSLGGHQQEQVPSAEEVMSSTHKTAGKPSSGNASTPPADKSQASKYDLHANKVEFVVQPKPEPNEEPAAQQEALQEASTAPDELAAKLEEVQPEADNNPVAQASKAPAAGGTAQSVSPAGGSYEPQQQPTAAVKTEQANVADKAESASVAQAGTLTAAPMSSTDEHATGTGSGMDVKPEVVLGCPKCRWAPKGCAVCRARWQTSGKQVAATLAAAAGAVPGGQASNTANIANTAADRAAMTRMTIWLMNRTSTLCTALKQTHQTSTASLQPQTTRVTLSAPATKLLPKQPGPVITTQQRMLSRPVRGGGGGATVVSSPGTAPVVQTGAGISAPGASQWQQQAVQLSQFRQQQRLIQQQQLAEAQRQQQQKLVLQQQQRQHHTSLLRQQHQTAQLQQQHQQALRTQAAAKSALQQQQQRMHQQQQQQGLRQQQLQQQQQQQLLQQQQQRQLTAQQQVQQALSRQSSQPGGGLQPRPAAVFASAAQHAQYQQQQPGLQGQMSHPLSKVPSDYVFLCSLDLLFQITWR